MGTSNSLPNVRTTSDLTIKVRLKDGGLAIDWTGLTDIKAWIYSDVQKAIAGRCTVSIDQADSTLLLCDYSAFKPQYLGVNRIIVQCKNEGRTKTYDTPALNFVPFSTMDSRETPLSNPDDIEAHIEVQDVSSSILDEVIIAALNATERANEAAAAAEHMVDIHTGPQGPQGPQGEEGPQGEQGPQGEDGPQGPTGATPDISIGTVETGAAGSEAEASMTGTPENPVLNLTIPRGDPGVVQAKYIEVQVLPTASASTMNALYLVPSELGTPNVYDVYYTSEVGRETYSWVKLCTTEINLSNYATKAELTQLEHRVDQLGNGMPSAVRLALYDLLLNAAYANGNGYSIKLATIREWAESLALTSISAVFEQGVHIVYTSDSLDSLKQYLVVTGTYEDNSTAEIDGMDYELSGTLEVGTSTITVTYQGKTDTFSVVVTASPYLYVREGADGFYNKLALHATTNNETNPLVIDGVSIHYTHSWGSASRISYPFFDLLLNQGQSYTFEIEMEGLSTYTLQLAFQEFNQSFYDDGIANQPGNHTSGMTDSGWKTPTLNAEHTKATYNYTLSGQNSVGTRITMKIRNAGNTADANIPNGFAVTKLIVKYNNA